MVNQQMSLNMRLKRIPDFEGSVEARRQKELREYKKQQRLDVIKSQSKLSSNNNS